MSVTPDFVGQRYKDTNTGNIWIANSTTPGDWTLEVQNMEMRWTPTSGRLSRLVGLQGNYSNVPSYKNLTALKFDFPTTNQSLEITGDDGTDPSVTSIRFDNLSSLTDGAYLSISKFSLVTELYLGLFVSCQGLSVSYMDVLEALSFDSFVSSFYDVYIKYNDLLESVSFPELQSVASHVSIANNAALTTISFPQFLPTNTKNFSGGSLLTDSTVNHILSRYVANPAYVSGVITLNAAGNAAPTGQGIVDKATLVGRGVTVFTN